MNSAPKIDFGINPIATKAERIGNLRVTMISLKAAVEALPHKEISASRLDEADALLNRALSIMRGTAR